jgi:DNA-3-methyladenine glycosylase
VIGKAQIPRRQAGKCAKLACMSRLTRDFFSRDARSVARDLLGQILVHQTGDRRLAGRIVETEAYTGWDDMASHGHRGKTPRNAAMFGPAGVSYVYLIYGVHWLLNVVARPLRVDYPAAVLLRAVEPVEGLKYMAARRSGRPQQEWTNGPGRLTMALGIDKAHDGLDLVSPESPIFFEEDETIPGGQVRTGPRVGIDVPEPWKSKPWRYWIADNPYVSRG